MAPGVHRLETSEVVSYLKEVVTPRLGYPEPGTFEPLNEESKITVIRWHTPSGETLYARFWGGRQKKDPVLQQLGAGRELEAAGLTIPRVVFADRSRATAMRWGFETTVETSAPEVAMTPDGNAEQLPLLARDLARLHTRRSDRWGRPWIPGASTAQPPRSHWQTRLKAFRKRITPRSTGLSAGEIASCMERLEEGIQRQANYEPVLVHGDLFRGHIYVGEDGGLTWIDLETVKYGLPEWDLGNIRLWLNAEEFDRFLETYQQARGEALDPDRIETAGLYAHMRRLYKRVRKARVSKEKRRRAQIGDRACEKVEQTLRELMAQVV